MLYSRKRARIAKAKAEAEAKTGSEAKPSSNVEAFGTDQFVFDPVKIKKENNREQLNSLAEKLECEGYLEAETKADVVDLIMAKAEAEAKTGSEAKPSSNVEAFGTDQFVFDPVKIKKENNREQLNSLAEKLECEGYLEAETKADVVDLIMAKAEKDSKE